MLHQRKKFRHGKGIINQPPLPARPPLPPRCLHFRRGECRRRVPEVDARQRGHEAGPVRVGSAGLECSGVEQLLHSGEETGAEPEMPVRRAAVEHCEDGRNQSSDRHHHS